MIKVNRYTRAGKHGKAIYCPHCAGRIEVNHFAWSAVVCPHCKIDVKKHEWDYSPAKLDKN